MTLNHLRNYLSLLRVKVGVGLYFPWWLRRSKNLPAVQETRIRSLGWEHPLEKGMATHSSILGPWVHGSMGPKEYSWSMGPEESDTTELLTHIPGLGSVILLLSTSSVVQENSVNTFLSCFSEHKLSPL